MRGSPVSVSARRRVGLPAWDYVEELAAGHVDDGGAPPAGAPAALPLVEGLIEAQRRHAAGAVSGAGAVAPVRPEFALGTDAEAGAAYGEAHCAAFAAASGDQGGLGDLRLAARTDGMRIADQQRRAWHRSQR